MAVTKFKRIDAVLREVRDELRVASVDHPPMRSAHEGYAVILEELDELWAEVKSNVGTAPDAANEAIQIAAMAVRYVVDLCGDDV